MQGLTLAKFTLQSASNYWQDKAIECDGGICNRYHAWQGDRCIYTQLDAAPTLINLYFFSGQVEKRYKDGSSEVRLPNGSIRYHDPKNEHVREEWRFPDGAALTVSANGEQRIAFSNGQIEVHAKDHKVALGAIAMMGFALQKITVVLIQCAISIQGLSR